VDQTTRQSISKFINGLQANGIASYALAFTTAFRMLNMPAADNSSQNATSRMQFTALEKCFSFKTVFMLF
jgi:hypothetical protein